MLDRVDVRYSEFGFDVFQSFPSDLIDSVLIAVSRFKLEIFLEEKFHLLRLKIQLDHPVEDFTGGLGFAFLDNLNRKT